MWLVFLFGCAKLFSSGLFRRCLDLRWWSVFDRLPYPFYCPEESSSAQRSRPKASGISE